MAENKGALKRYGTRYGTTIRQKLAEVESMQKREYECPNCKQKKVKRVCLGIWQCKKCNIKFTGKAYTISKKIKIQEELLNNEGNKVAAPKKRRKIKIRAPEEQEEAEEQEE